jgi:hypothetical protein
LERFGRALRLHWLWLKWKHTEKLWANNELPVDNVDEAHFATATRVKVKFLRVFFVKLSGLYCASINIIPDSQKKKVHNSRTALFWTSSWLKGVSPAAVFPALYKHSKRKRRAVADALANDNWIRDIIHNIKASLITEYILLWELVDAAAFNNQDKNDDEIVWTRSADGSYSARSTYRIQFDGSSESIFPASIWKQWVPSKCKFFL